MRTLIAAVGLIGVFVSHAAFAQAPADGQPGATTPPPAETSPPPAVAAPGSAGAPAPFGPAAGPGGPSIWGVLPWGGFGLGARYMIPLPITQLLTRTKFHDYWALEFGADILRFNYDYGLGASAYSYSWTEIIPVVGMMWQFWINDSFAVYPKIELGYAVGWYSDTNGSTTGLSGGNHFFPDGTAGLLYKLGNGITLRAEAGYVGGKAGIAWLF
jgi:hypothetical protein